MWRFQVPPGWPTPPPGWVPPPEWDPDPGWPPPPPGWQFWMDDGGAFDPRPIQTPTAEKGKAAGGWLAVAGGVMVTGSLLPWAVGLGGGISVPGTSGDGRITLLLGLVVGIGGLIIVTGPPRQWVSVVALVLAALGAVIGAIELINGQSIVSSAFGLVQLGPGIWVTLVGSVLAVAMAITTTAASKS